jgi:hypothetical protein
MVGLVMDDCTAVVAISKSASENQRSEAYNVKTVLCGIISNV